MINFKVIELIKKLIKYKKQKKKKIQMKQHKKCFMIENILQMLQQ